MLWSAICLEGISLFMKQFIPPLKNAEIAEYFEREYYGKVYPDSPIPFIFSAFNTPSAAVCYVFY